MTPDLHKQIDKQINSINSITFHQSLGVFSKFDLDMPTPKIQSVFYGSISTSSCGLNFEDIDMRSFANCRRRRFFYMQHMVIFHYFFLKMKI